MGPLEQQSEIQRLNWTLTAITKVNSILVRATTELELYAGICEAVTFQDIFALAWIGIPQNDEEKNIRVLQGAGKALPYLDGIVVTWDDSPSGNGPSGRAVKSGQPQFNNNMLDNPQFSPWLERAKKWNLKSSFCLPIKLRSGEVVAILMVYSEIPAAFGESEFALLSQLGDDIGFGVDSIRTHAAYIAETQRRQQAETEAHRHLDELARMGRVAVVQSLTTSFAHEISQPLGAILSNAEAAQLLISMEHVDKSEVVEALADIRSNTCRISEIIRNLRNLVSRHDAETQDFCLNQLIVDTHKLVQWDMKSLAIQVNLSLDHALPRIRGNAVHLQQVLMNLIANARDALLALKDHSGEITIKTFRHGDASVAVSVSDNGAGIPDEIVHSIFDPFFTTKTGGTGMGLWLSRALIERHGGTLTHCNEPSAGACFCVILPNI